ncbi:hypothetical protein BK661_27880 [Pseudomonas frederiksbergensis]|uniref:Uncharacterized protein n=1 Tax=Pseudomonas frederiksbergensis TaxID=104087 RepID=A0A423I9W0_9PSED|nr:hypothetical protein BK661_27880 [Pseudomonas frederiksbergensis]
MLPFAAITVADFFLVGIFAVFPRVTAKKETLRPGGFEWCRPYRVARKRGGGEMSVGSLNARKDERFPA